MFLSHSVVNFKWTNISFRPQNLAKLINEFGMKKRITLRYITESQLKKIKISLNQMIH